MNLSSQSRAKCAVRLAMVAIAQAAIIGLAFELHAQTLLEPTETPVAITASVIQGRMRSVQDCQDLDEATRTKILDIYKQAIAELETAQKWNAQVADFAARTAALPDRVNQVKAELENIPQQSTLQCPLDGTLSQLEQVLQQRETELAEAQKALADLDEEPKRRANRRVEIPKLLAAARDRLAEIDKQSAIPVSGEDSAYLLSARAAWMDARRQSSLAEIAAMEKELTYYDASAELVPMRRDLQKRHARLAAQIVKTWQEGVTQRRQQEVAQQSRNAELTLERVPSALRALAEQNLSLAEERKEVDGQIKAVRAKLANSKTQHESLKTQLQSVLDQEKAIGLTHALGMLLRKQRSSLPELTTLRRHNSERQQQIGDAQFKLLELQGQRAAIGDVDEQLEILLNHTDVSEGGFLHLDSEARELLTVRRDYLDGLLTDYNTYFESLVNLDSSQQQLIATARQYTDYIDERVLWIRSADPVAAADFGDATEAATWLLRPGRWMAVTKGLIGDLIERPLPTILGFAFFVPLVVYRLKLRKVIQLAGRRAADASCRSILPTLRTLAGTSLVSVLWPALLFCLGWRLATLPGSIVLAGPLSAGMFTAAAVFFPLEMWRQVSRPRGLAQAHFGCTENSLSALRRHLRWLIPVVVPLSMLVVMFNKLENPAWENSLGRWLFVGLLLAVSFFLQRVLSPKGGVLREVIAARKGGWADRLSGVWYPLGFGLPLVLAGAAAMGYFYTAGQLALRFQMTGFLILLVVLASALIFRWIYVNQLKIAAQQARIRVEEAIAAKATANDQVDSKGLLSEVAGTKPAEAELIDLVKIDQQTRRLVRSFAVLVGILGAWIIWSDVVPALNFLERVKLWDSVVEVGGTATLPDGSTVAQTTKHYKAITLSHLAVSLLVVAMTFVAIKNIPGLLEVAILQRLPLDAALRFAITTVTRYVLTIVGVAWSLSTLGWGWENIQWLVAAVSVGLGFGLQEIFANFISGLILLFERPLRAGDIVTVGDVTGKVIQIRTRATVIQDWDRKELVMPNKEFITGRLLNWTLSDAVNRVVVQVGVAYGSDTARTRHIIMSVAEEHLLVLKDPAPSVTFDQFADSSLNFTLRVYLPNLDNRLAVIHELHATIHDRLGEEGIAIAFPQRDLHIRSIEAPMTVVRNESTIASMPEQRKSA